MPLDADVPQPSRAARLQAATARFSPPPDRPARSRDSAIPGTGKVDGQQQRRAARRLGALDHRLDEAAVLDRYRAGTRSRARRRATSSIEQTLTRRQGEGTPRRRGRARRLHLAAARIHAGQADRAEADRQRPVAARTARSRVSISRDVAQHPLAQRDGLQVGDVPPQRHLVVRAAVDIFEQEMRQPRLRQRAIIADATRPSLRSRSSGRGGRPCAAAPARRANWRRP